MKNTLTNQQKPLIIEAKVTTPFGQSTDRPPPQENIIIFMQLPGKFTSFMQFSTGSNRHAGRPSYASVQIESRLFVVTLIRKDRDESLLTAHFSIYHCQSRYETTTAMESALSILAPLGTWDPFPRNPKVVPHRATAPNKGLRNCVCVEHSNTSNAMRRRWHKKNRTPMCGNYARFGFCSVSTMTKCKNGIAPSQPVIIRTCLPGCLRR